MWMSLGLKYSVVSNEFPFDLLNVIYPNNLLKFEMTHK